MADSSSSIGARASSVLRPRSDEDATANELWRATGRASGEGTARIVGARAQRASRLESQG
jgi:hypothetical protein